MNQGMTKTMSARTWTTGKTMMIGIVAGVFPAFNAMLLSRARAARRAAEEQYRVELEEIRSDGVASHPTKYGQQKVNKALTGPVPVSMGPAPNAASLYPVIDDAPGQ